MNNILIALFFLYLSSIQTFKTMHLANSIYCLTNKAKQCNIYSTIYYNHNTNNNNNNNNNNNSKNNNNKNKKNNSGCDHRPFIKNVTYEEECKYNFSKNLHMLHLLNTLRDNNTPIYYKLFLIDNYRLIPTLTNDNTKIETGYNLLSGGLLDKWNFDF